MRRNIVRFIKDNKRNCIHFTSDINNLSSKFDLWLSLDSGKSFFENIEYILTNLNEAHNITTISQLNEFDYEVVYNSKKLG